MNFLKDLTWGGKIVMLLVIVGLLVGVKFGYSALFPKKAKKAVITTKAAGAPLAYDKTSNAPFRPLPSFNEPADVQAPEIRGFVMGWNGFAAGNYAVGGTTTSKGSIAEELGLNIHLSNQNSCTEQANQLYAFAQELHEGKAQPTKGCHFVNWMADAAANYLAGLNDRLTKDFGPEFRAEIVTFTGASFGEDKWMLKPKYAKDARGSLTATVIRDGDWNICITKCQLMGWEPNHDLGTYDRTKVNFVAAPNDDYVEAGKLYTSGQKITLKIVENGKITDRDTTMTVTGVSSWFPVDQQAVEGKGGLITVASTADYSSQMACGIVMIKKWCDDNSELVTKMVEAFGKGGDQIKSHDEALAFASQVSEVVFNDKEKNAEAWYNAYKTFTLTDDDGNEVSIGGSRAFSLADAAKYTGISGGTDIYKSVYNRFGNISKEAYPEVLSSFPDYSEATDWKFLRAAYNKAKGEGKEGSVSGGDFTTAQKGAIAGDRSYAIQFETGSANIKPESYPVLDDVVEQLTIADNLFVEVAGHTDNTGNPQANKTLSQARAASVKSYLIQKNKDLNAKGRLSSAGYGQDRPLPGVDGSTKEGQAKNRRVEIKLYKAQRQ